MVKSRGDGLFQNVARRALRQARERSAPRGRTRVSARRYPDQPHAGSMFRQLARKRQSVVLEIDEPHSRCCAILAVGIRASGTGLRAARAPRFDLPQGVASTHKPRQRSRSRASIEPDLFLDRHVWRRRQEGRTAPPFHPVNDYTGFKIIRTGDVAAIELAPRSLPAQPTLDIGSGRAPGHRIGTLTKAAPSMTSESHAAPHIRMLYPPAGVLLLRGGCARHRRIGAENRHFDATILRPSCVRVRRIERASIRRGPRVARGKPGRSFSPTR